MQLAAIDLDGTLLRSDGTVSSRTREAVSHAGEAGVEIVLVSARGPRGVREAADELGVSGEAICSNGGVVLDLASGAFRRERTLETEVALELVHGLRDRLPGILFAVEREAFSHEPGFAAWDWQPPKGTRVADAVELLEEAPTKLVLRHADHEVEAIAALARRLAGARASVSLSGEWVVEVSAAGVNKASALAELCEELGVAAADVVAFGDQLNDLPMLAWAGHGVAVANAHPDVIDVADEVTASNDEDGVALVLERLCAP
ncbi:MAG TPA: Cof-type HAD-IIB family hydrolase [Gaiellaceae bacterium]|nr:Cof-type HAD-IIB family hydrolase [Gaiellaceae bacterium]